MAVEKKVSIGWGCKICLENGISAKYLFVLRGNYSKSNTLG